MFKRLVSGLMFTLLLVNVLMLTFNVQPTKGEWTGTVYIRADGSIDPPDAPITTYDNITYTLAGNIRSTGDGIVIERNNIIIDGAGYTLHGIDAQAIGEYPYKGIDLTERSNVTIKNIRITSFYYGMLLSFSSNNSIYGNDIKNNGYGIHLVYSSYNSIYGNDITANSYYGIYLYYSSNNNITGNIFTDNGLHVYDSYKNSVNNNTVNGKPLVYLEEVSNHIITDAGQVILVKCHNIKVEGLNIFRTTVGIQLWGTSNSTISGNNIANNCFGILLYYSSNNSIFGNIITNNDDGVVGGCSSNNSIYGNDIKNNGYGFQLDSFSNNSIYRNNITNNYLEGIWLKGYSNRNSISENYVTNNSEGILLDSTLGNRIYKNNIANNGVDVRLYSSIDDSIYNNSVGSISIHFSSNDSISGNNVTINVQLAWGVYMETCLNVNFSHNFIKAPLLSYVSYAVLLNNCSSSFFKNNVIEGNFSAGFNIASCYNLTFEENAMRGVFSGFSIYGYPPKLQHFLHNISSSNLVNDKPTYYLVNMSNLDINQYEYPEIGYLALVNCTNITVRNRTLERQEVTLAYTKNSSIINCTFSRASLHLQCSHDNFFSDNSIVDGYISLEYSFNNVFRKNSISYYEYQTALALYVYDVALEGYINDVDLSNTIDGRPIIYWVNQRKATVPENASLVLLVNCTEIVVQNLHIINIPLFAAIELVSSVNCSIRNNVIKSYDFGIYVGVYLRESSSNYIYGNILEGDFVGIALGRLAGGSNNNQIWNNTFKDCVIGFYPISANNNKIFHNNFIDNNLHVKLGVSALNNSWDDGYPYGGNYWSDYNGGDLYSGPYENVTGSDGIGDTPYVINENNTDRYPLMGPFGGLTFKGQNVTAYPSSEVCLIFENVTSEGETSVNVTNVGPEPPSGFMLAGNYYDIKTTANYSGTIRLRIAYDDSNMTLEEEMSLRLMQWNEALGQWVDITTSIDTGNNVVFGETTHLSIFAILTTALAPPPLSVSISPLSASIIIGQSVSFISTVSGGYPPYSYQWHLNGSVVSGATSSTWTFTPLTIGTYKVYLNVTDSSGNVAISDTATITVAPQLTISISPMSASILVGQSVTFTSTTSGGYPPYTYQWFLNGNPVSGATSNTWTFTPTSSGIYYVYLKVTDDIGNTAQSETARITVATVPVGGYSIPIEC